MGPEFQLIYVTEAKDMFDKLGGRKIFYIFALLIFVACADLRTDAQTVLVACTWDTSSIFAGKDRHEKFERRFYVSPIVSMPQADFLRIDADGDRIEGLCGDYIDKTVIKAATERGERLDPGGQLRVRRNIELSGEDVGSKNMYRYARREDLQILLDSDRSEMEDAGRFIVNFSWDVTGKSVDSDYASEKKRSIPTTAPVKKP
jgi:hypothetical protein